MHTPDFDFEALGMADINAAAKKVNEEQEAARKAARRIAEEKEREAKAKKITAIANSALTHTLTADDVAYILRQYAQDTHPDFPAEDFDADTIENYVEMTVAVFSNMKFLLPSGTKQVPGKTSVGKRAEVPGILNFDEAFKQLFPNHDEKPAATPKTDDEVLRSFVNRILK